VKGKNKGEEKADGRVTTGGREGGREGAYGPGIVVWHLSFEFPPEFGEVADTAKAVNSSLEGRGMSVKA
jgi:hypothetical protein